MIEKQNIRVLIVDDMEAMRRVLKRHCKSFGLIQFIEADGGIQAWKCLNESQSEIHFVISDWNMSDCSGLELLNKMKADTRFSKIPFLMITAEAEKSRQDLALKSGANSILAKPFDQATFHQILTKFISY